MINKLDKVIKSLIDLDNTAQENNEPILSAILGLNVVRLIEIKKELLEDV